jgi:hypothetical protein
VHVDHDVEGDAVVGRRPRQRADVVGVIDHDHRVGRLAGQAREPADGARRHDLGGDEQSAHAGARHHLGLAQLGARHAERAGRHLAFRDLRTAVGLGVRAQVLPGRAHVRRHACEVALEAVQVEEQRGGRDLVTVHGTRLYTARSPTLAGVRTLGL